MAITKAEISTAMQDRTLRTDITSIDQELQAILADLSNKFGFLEKTNSVTIAASGTSVALPSDYRNIHAAVITSSGAILDPISYPEYLCRLAFNATAGIPTAWATFGDTIYVHPKATASTGLTLSYNYQAFDPDSIVFPDAFQEAIIEGVCFKAYETRGQAGEAPAAAAHKTLYDEQMTALMERYKKRKD